MLNNIYKKSKNHKITSLIILIVFLCICVLHKWNYFYMILCQGCQTHFHQRPYKPRGCLQRAECNFNSLVVKE